MKKVFTFAFVLLTALAHARTQNDTTQANQPIDIFANVGRFSIARNMFNYETGKGVVLACPIKRYKNNPSKYVWNQRGFDVAVKAVNIPHNGYPGIDYADQSEFISFNLSKVMDATTGAGYFVDGTAGEWVDDPTNPNLQIYVYQTGGAAYVTIAMKSILISSDNNVYTFATGWEFDAQEKYKVIHNVILRPRKS